MNVHVITGEDDFRVGEAAKKIVGDGVGLEVVDVNAAGLDLDLLDEKVAATILAVVV